MARDLDAVLAEWEFTPSNIQARLISALNGRKVIQVRIDLGVLQLEITGRPDGAKPHGFETYFEYLQVCSRREPDFVMDEEQCREADREFVQFYHRRIAWLALQRFAEAICDADHTLAFMDLLRTHSPNAEYTTAHEQYRNFVLFHRTQAAAALAAADDQPETAVDEIRKGLAKMKRYYVENECEDRVEDDTLMQTLQQMERTLREIHSIDSTLQEKLESAIANENYEEAARLRDQLAKRE